MPCRTPERPAPAEARRPSSETHVHDPAHPAHLPHPMAGFSVFPEETARRAAWELLSMSKRARRASVRGHVCASTVHYASAAIPCSCQAPQASMFTSPRISRSDSDNTDDETVAGPPRRSLLSPRPLPSHHASPHRRHAHHKVRGP